MATLDELVVRIRADASALDRELRRATATTRQQAAQMGSALDALKGQFAALVPAVSAAALVEFGRRAVDAAGHLNDLAARIGFSASTLSALEPALAASGSGVDDFAASVGILNNQMGEALKGNQEAIKAFDSLGLSVRALATMDDEQRFYAVADALAAVGDQARFTEAGRNLLGRGFLAMAPTIREANGHLGEHVQHLKDTKAALSQDTIDRVDAFGDALSNAAIRAKNSFLEAFAAVLKVVDVVGKTLPSAQESTNARLSNYGIADGGRRLSAADLRTLSANARGSVQEPTVVNGYTFDAKGRLVAPGSRSARGSNAGLLKPAGGAKGDKGTKAEAEDYDKLNDALGAYLTNLENERELAGLSGKALAVRRAELEASALAVKQNTLLAPDQLARIRGEAAATYDLAEAHRRLEQKQRDAAETARELRNQMRDGLTDIALHFDSAGESAGKFFETIAGNVLKKKVTGPLSDAIGAFIDTSGVFDFLGLSGARASGGPVGGGQSYLVGEKGPEIFTPGSSGYVTPNSRLGSGAGVTVTNTWHIGGGVTRQELAALIPVIEQRAQTAVLAAVEKGGRAAQIVGKRN